MVSLLPESFIERLEYIKSEVLEDEEVDNWFLMNRWEPIVFIVVAYLVFVKIVGPKMMEDRKPYDLRGIIRVYNLIQTCYNAYIVYLALMPSSVSYLVTHSCSPLPAGENPLSRTFYYGSYLYFIAKIIDLLDTIFFVLRKKQSQITFLHVYHHAMMVLATWAFLRYFKGEQGIFIGALNSLVHVVMYFYYFLAAFGPEVQKYLWWKKYITKFQLTQFMLFCVHQLSLLIFQCNMPIALTYFIFSQAVVMVILFGNFYYQTYTKKHHKQEKATN